MSQHLISTPPNRSWCNNCGRLTLSGLDAGVPYTVDAAPLTLLGEIQARLAGRVTYRLVAGFIWYRELSDIQAGKSQPVLAEHSCDPIQPEHVDPAHIAAVLPLTADPFVAPGNNTLFVAAGADGFIPDNETPPF